jgi:hypothetical protein
MKASFSTIPKIKIFSSVDAKYFLALAVITTVTISAYYFLKPKEKKQN